MKSCKLLGAALAGLLLGSMAFASFVSAGSEQDPEIADPHKDATIGGIDIVKGWFAEETQTSFSIHLMVADLENAGPFGTSGNENAPCFRVWFVFEPTNITYIAEASKSVTFGEQYTLYCVEFENNGAPKAMHSLANISGEWNTSAKQVVLTVEKSMINVSKIEGGSPVYDSTKTPKVGDRIISPFGEAIMWGWTGGGAPSALGNDSTSPGRAYTFSVAPTPTTTQTTTTTSPTPTTTTPPTTPPAEAPWAWIGVGIAIVVVIAVAVLVLKGRGK
jgi:hypothetical protein